MGSVGSSDIEAKSEQVAFILILFQSFATLWKCNAALTTSLIKPCRQDKMLYPDACQRISPGKTCHSVSFIVSSFMSSLKEKLPACPWCSSQGNHPCDAPPSKSTLMYSIPLKRSTQSIRVFFPGLHEDAYKDKPKQQHNRNLRFEDEYWNGETICHPWFGSVPSHVNGHMNGTVLLTTHVNSFI